MNRPKKYEGFTLIEILVVVGLIAILAAITIVAINPARNFRQTRDTQRSSDISAILNAITQYTSEEGNTLDSLVTATGFTGTLASCTDQPSTTSTPIGNNVAVADQGTLIDLSAVLVTVGDYIVAIPEDPNGATDTAGGSRNTGYAMCTTSTGRVQVLAPNTEGDGDDLYVVR